MKKFIAVAAIAVAFTSSAMAAQVKGFVSDAKCSTQAGMKGNSACAKSCIKNGGEAVLVTEDGKIYKVANQDAIRPHAGETVTVDGDIKDGVITVASVK